MRKTILALATAGALAGTALPTLAHDYDDVYGRPYYRSDYYRDYYRPYHRRYDNDDYRPHREHHWLAPSLFCSLIGCANQRSLIAQHYNRVDTCWKVFF